MSAADKRAIMNRLKRIEGQIRGIERMIEDGQCCSDVLDQVAAARIALYNAGVLILENHARDCLFIKETGEDKDYLEDAVDELVRIVKKFAKS